MNSHVTRGTIETYFPATGRKTEWHRPGRKESAHVVFAGGWEDFADTAYDPADPELSTWPAQKRGRVAAFRPGGPGARLLARHNVVMVVGDTVLVHGALVPNWLSYGLEAMNADTQAWMRGERDEPAPISALDGPVWDRTYSHEVDEADCELLAEVLTSLKAARMVVAHTPQEEGISSVCEDKAWRVDVGLADYYGGETAVLEIRGSQVTVLRK